MLRKELSPRLCRQYVCAGCGVLTQPLVDATSSGRMTSNTLKLARRTGVKSSVHLIVLNDASRLHAVRGCGILLANIGFHRIISGRIAIEGLGAETGHGRTGALIETETE